jgi:hypothetical protein
MPYDQNSTKADAKELKAAVLDILVSHVGACDPIKARDIARRLGRTGRYADRPIREAIRALRKEGFLILSSVRSPAGYFLAANAGEWEQFRDSNLRPRALDILETSRAMGQAAQVRWGGQLALELPEPALPWVSDLVV